MGDPGDPRRPAPTLERPHAMLKAIRQYFDQSMRPATEEVEVDARAGASGHELRLAACALLLELAWADDDFSELERQHVDFAVRRHFGLDHAHADRLIELAEEARRGAVDLWQFTSLIRENYSTGQKMVLAEIMWGLVFADGDLSNREDYLLRKISTLLDLKVAYLSEAKKRAREGGSALDVD